MLLQEGDSICTAAETHQSELGTRLPANYLIETRKLINKVSASDAEQKVGGAAVGALTKDQNAKMQEVQNLLGKVRESAKRAFKGQDVKLHDEFQVGANKPGDLASLLQRARIVLVACGNASNAEALTAVGWLAADTTKLSEAVNALDAVDNTQEAAKSSKAGATAQRNEYANDLYERLLTIQNAADIQWPANLAANTTVRGEFRIGMFPPRPGAGATKQTVQGASTSSSPSAPAANA